MNNTLKFLEDLDAQKGFKAKLKKKLYGGILPAIEAASVDIDERRVAEEALAQEQAQLRGETARISAEQVAFSDKIARLSAEQARLSSEQARFSEEQRQMMMEIGQLKQRAEELSNGADFLGERITAVEQALTGHAGTIGALRSDLDNISDNLRNNNITLEHLNSDSEFMRVKLGSLSKNIKNLSVGTVTVSTGGEAAPAAPAVSESDYDCIDYFDFENHFRGSIESIKKAQEVYLPYFRGKKRVLDIGCGRGEFLSLLRENDIPAKGVDIYEPYVDYCNSKGLKAVCGDGTAFLAGVDYLDGIFVGQVVEHLKPEEIIRLCNTAYEKLSEGGCIIIETPNPTSLAIYTNAFYIDPSHIKPVHPLTMKYYLEKAGFRNIETLFTENSRPPYSIPELALEGAGEFNSAMKQLSDILYGSQDYAVIAVK